MHAEAHGVSLHSNDSGMVVADCLKSSPPPAGNSTPSSWFLLLSLSKLPLSLSNYHDWGYVSNYPAMLLYFPHFFYLLSPPLFSSTPPNPWWFPLLLFLLLSPLSLFLIGLPPCAHKGVEPPIIFVKFSSF